MKKILAMVLAMMLVLSMSAAFAATVDTTNWVSAADEKAITLKKIYTVTGSTDSSLYPTETLKFSVAVPANVTNPDNTMITVDDLVVVGNSNQTIYINLPVYDTVGVYEYTITENDGTAQGVTYTDAAINVKVLVSYNYTDECLDTKIVLNSTTTSTSTNEDGREVNTTAKVDTFENKYDVGHLTVAKTISGNLADSTVYFKMTVTLESAGTVESDITVSGGSDEKNPTTIPESEWTKAEGATKYSVTKTIYLRAGETLTFSNIPNGVTYTVVEDKGHILQADETFDPNSDADKQYTVEYTNETGTIATGETDAASVNNDKETTVSTGIALDNAPYMILMALVVIAGAALIVKRASANR